MSKDLWIVQPAAGNPPDRAVQPPGARGQGSRFESGPKLHKVFDILLVRMNTLFW